MTDNKQQQFYIQSNSNAIQVALAWCIKFNDASMFQACSIKYWSRTDGLLIAEHKFKYVMCWASYVSRQANASTSNAIQSGSHLTVRQSSEMMSHSSLLTATKVLLLLTTNPPSNCFKCVRCQHTLPAHFIFFLTEHASMILESFGPTDHIFALLTRLPVKHSWMTWMWARVSRYGNFHAHALLLGSSLTSGMIPWTLVERECVHRRYGWFGLFLRMVRDCGCKAKLQYIDVKHLRFFITTMCSHRHKPMT